MRPTTRLKAVTLAFPFLILLGITTLLGGCGDELLSSLVPAEEGGDDFVSGLGALQTPTLAIGRVLLETS